VSALADPFVRDTLACPTCLAAPLDRRDDPRIGDYLLCTACGGLYPISDGVPHLLDLEVLLRLPIDLLAVWHLTQQRAAPLYDMHDPGSCSLRTRDDVRTFQRFMGLAAKSVLDVGSGSSALPGYADGSEYYADGRGWLHFVGLDPLPPRGEPVFPIVVGIGERLPFRDGAFDSAILATSLDHALDVEVTLAEVRRVLRPDGEAYFWGMFETEERLGRPVAVPLPPRGSVRIARSDDPVAHYLALDARRRSLVQRFEQEDDRYAREIVDAYHFRHLDRDTTLRAFRRADFLLRDEQTYTSAAGDSHSFMRFVCGAPVAEELLGATDDLAAMRETLELLRAEVAELRQEGAESRALGALAWRKLVRAARIGRRVKYGLRLHQVAAVAAVAGASVTSKRATRRRGGTRILMLTISQLEWDPRIRKMARSLAEAGLETEILAQANGAKGTVELEPGVRRTGVERRAPLGTFFFYQDEYRRAARTRDFDFVHANDLTTLTAAYVIARERGVPLVYDAHELWTENVEFRGGDWVPMSPRTRWVATQWENFLLKHVDVFVTVGPSIAAHYARLGILRRPPLLVPNFPTLSLLDVDTRVPSIREACGLDEHHFVTLYLGGVSALRNIEGVIEAHAHLPTSHVFVVRGPGVETYADHCRALARRLGVEDRLFLLPPVPMDNIVAAAAGADAGIVMLRNICKNFYWFYPNKLFDYALAGLPIAVSEFPDVTKFVNDERCGVTFDPDSPHSIAEALRWLEEHRDEARAMGERARTSILQRHNWENGVKALVDAYGELA
jgi:glycosyltransferase involved in cell wall biosynthesis/SAM-dependent methyltransferase